MKKLTHTELNSLLHEFDWDYEEVTTFLQDSNMVIFDVTKDHLYLTKDVKQYKLSAKGDIEEI